MDKIRKVLVIDGSRVVRATLNKHLKDSFKVVEEADGESAWQTLMLDSDIVAVISGIHPPKLEAHDLLLRLRASSLRRLHKIPFILIVSDTEDRAEREIDLQRGVAGFITKSMKKTVIIECLESLLDLNEQEYGPSKEPRSLPASSKAHDRLLDSDKFRGVLSALTFSETQSDEVCALVFGIDNRDELISSFGQSVAGMIDARFAALLMAKVGAPDSIGRCRGERLAIVSHGADLAQGERFGKQVCRSLASGQISIRGQKVRLTVSVGVASTSDDFVANGSELLALADQRLDQALVCGGNTVVTEFRPSCPLRCRDENVLKLLEALKTPSENTLSGQIGTLGLQILPLIRAMDQALKLDLPLDSIHQQLMFRAKTETAAR